MVFVFILLSFLNYLCADYTLSFAENDLHFLKKIMSIASTINKDCSEEFDTKRKIIKEFIKYGNRKGFTQSTHFAKGRTIAFGENQMIHQIQFDPKLFDLTPDTLLTISIFHDWTFTVSDAMEKLIKKFLKTFPEQKNRSNKTIE